jgi:hypothetical protein
MKGQVTVTQKTIDLLGGVLGRQTLGHGQTGADTAQRPQLAPA